MKFKRSIFNIITGIISQSIIILLGFFIPRLLIYNYGSEINGLLTSVTQIYSYMALMEAGIFQKLLLIRREGAGRSYQIEELG